MVSGGVLGYVGVSHSVNLYTGRRLNRGFFRLGSVAGRRWRSLPEPSARSENRTIAIPRRHRAELRTFPAAALKNLSRRVWCFPRVPRGYEATREFAFKTAPEKTESQANSCAGKFREEPAPTRPRTSSLLLFLADVPQRPRITFVSGSKTDDHRAGLITHPPRHVRLPSRHRDINLEPWASTRRFHAKFLRTRLGIGEGSWCALESG